MTTWARSARVGTAQRRSYLGRRSMLRRAEKVRKYCCRFSRFTMVGRQVREDSRMDPSSIAPANARTNSRVSRTHHPKRTCRFRRHSRICSCICRRNGRSRVSEIIHYEEHSGLEAGEPRCVQRTSSSLCPLLMKHDDHFTKTGSGHRRGNISATFQLKKGGCAWFAFL